MAQKSNNCKRENILTVIEVENKLGLLDARRLNCVIPKYDKIKFTLTVKSEKNGVTSVRKYKLFSAEGDLDERCQQ